MMRATIKVLAAALSAGILAGCWQMPPQPQPQLAAEAPALEAAVAQPAARTPVPAIGDGGIGESAVDSALIWSEKYSQAMERLMRLEQQNRELERRNQQLLEQLTRAESELRQTQQELRDANDLLLEMRKELKQWKLNVLGFRDEIRTAQHAQIKALEKVIRLLGGEVVEPPATQPAGAQAKKNHEPSAKSPGA
jgi:hypothetical protein